MKFDMSKAWNDATAMISANREVLLIVAGLFFFLPGVILSMAMPALPPLDSMEEAAMNRFMDIIQGFYADYWWLILLSFLAQLIGYLSLLALLRDDRNPTVGAAIATAVKGLLPAIGAYILFIIGVALAVSLLVGLAAASGVEALAGVAVIIAFVGMIYVSIKVSLAAPVIAIDRVMNPFKVLARSWRLTKGNSLRIFAFYVLIMVAYFVLSIVVGLLAMALTAIAGDMAQALLSTLVSTAATILFVAVLAAIHRQLAGPSAKAVSQTFD